MFTLLKQEIGSDFQSQPLPEVLIEDHELVALLEAVVDIREDRLGGH